MTLYCLYRGWIVYRDLAHGWTAWSRTDATGVDVRVSSSSLTELYRQINA